MGSAKTNTIQAGMESHSLTASLTPEGLKLGVSSSNKWVILATVVLLVFGFAGTVISLALILR